VPNLITTPRLWRNKAILVKLEGAGAYGVDTTPTGAANWIEARNVSLTPTDTEKVARNIDLPYLGSSGNINVANWSKFGFDVAMAASGVAGTAPKWSPLMMACGCAETISPGVSVAYNLVSTDFSSICSYINIDGVLHKLLGGRGECKGKLSGKGLAMFSYSYDVLYIAPVTGGMPAVTRTGWVIEDGVNSGNTQAITINGIDLSFSSFEWSLGNKIARIDLPGPQREIAITDRAPQASVTVLAPALADFDPFALVESGIVVDLTNTHGKIAGEKVQTDMKARVIGVDYDRIDEMLAYKLTLEPTPVAGNDEIAITCL
jgi:hypothetical protein